MLLPDLESNHCTALPLLIGIERTSVLSQISTLASGRVAGDLGSIVRCVTDLAPECGSRLSGVESVAEGWGMTQHEAAYYRIFTICRIITKRDERRVCHVEQQIRRRAMSLRSVSWPDLPLSVFYQVLLPLREV